MSAAKVQQLDDQIEALCRHLSTLPPRDENRRALGAELSRLIAERNAAARAANPANFDTTQDSITLYNIFKRQMASERRVGR